MKLDKHAQAKANLAGLTSAVQQAEMKIILAGRWPPLKPLPVFKYETDEYRAAVDFDKMRGEWVCRKTSFPSNKVEEHRGGLREITMALPHGQAEGPTEDDAAGKQQEELERDANRRLRAIHEWREKYENGARYSELKDCLSESQQYEIEESIRLTLTARQLQCNPKNVAYVFDALSKAGGRLATLMEIAQRNKMWQGAGAETQEEGVTFEAERHVPAEAMHSTRDRRLQERTTPVSRADVEFGDTNGGIVLNISETGMAVVAAEPLVAGDYLPRIRFQLPISGQSIEISAQIVWLAESKKDAGMRFVDLTADARHQISNWIASEKATSEIEDLTPAPVENLSSASLEEFPTELIGSVFHEEEQTSSAELIAHTASQAAEIVRPEILDERPLLLVEDSKEKVHDYYTPVRGFGPQVRRDKVESAADRIEESRSHLHVLEISGFQVATFALAVLCVVISFAVGLTVGRGPLEKSLRDAQKSTVAGDATTQAVSSRPGEMASRMSTPAAANTLDTPAENPPWPEKEKSRSESPSVQSLNARSAGSTTPVKPPDSTGLITRNAPPPASPKRTYSPKAVGPINGATRRPASRRATPERRAIGHWSQPSTVLITGPGDGSKPFRLFFPEKTIAASSSFAMTSQLSVLVSPEPGRAMAHEPTRLQAGGLVSFVWPRYSRSGDRYGSAEIVKVHTTVGKLGQVLDIKLGSGSSSLFPAATSAIRQWRYKPTLLNKRPVEAQQDITIEFRPSEYLSRVSTQHPSHN